MAHGMADYRLHRHQGNAPTSIAFDLPILVYAPMESGTWKWNNSGNPAGWVAGFDPAAAYFNTTGARLQTTPVAPAAGDWVQIDRDIIVSDNPETTFSMLFRSPNPSNQIRYITSTIDRNTPAVRAMPSIRYDGVNGIWQANVFMVGWVTFAETSFLGGDHWHRASFVNDAVLGNYGMFQIDNRIIDLTNLAFPLLPPVGEEYTNAAIRIATTGANQVTFDLDNIILQNI